MLFLVILFIKLDFVVYVYGLYQMAFIILHVITWGLQALWKMANLTIKWSCMYVCYTVINRCQNNNPCLNGGTCHDNIGTGGIVCRCPPSYTGINCQSGNCLVRSFATLEIFIQTSSFAVFSKIRYIRINFCIWEPCAYFVFITVKNNPAFVAVVVGGSLNACSSSPCQHGGTCSILSGKYFCRCTSSYRGNNCQTGWYESSWLLL